MKIEVLVSLVILFLLASSAGAEDSASTGTANESQKNIVETAIAAGNFNTLVGALKATGLADTLSSPGPFTVFAPTDEAFAKVPRGVLGEMMANKTLLTAVLKRHIILGAFMSSELKDGMSLIALEGSDVKITIDTDGVKANDAKVITPDVRASNGVIHITENCFCF